MNFNFHSLLLDKDDTHTYELTLWYMETGVDQSNDMGKSLNARVNIIDISKTNPYATGVEATDKNNLAYNIIENAINGTNGTTLLNAPLTEPVKEGSSFKYIKVADPIAFSSTTSSATNYYIAYASDYSVNPTTGKITLGTEESPAIIMDSKYVYSSDLANTLAGKYAYWSTSKPTTSTLSALSSAYKISTNTSDITSSSIKYASIEPGYESTEKVLSVTADDHGTTYYYRGGVQDNYLLFNNMCFRIVRINGDGSVKITLAGEVSEGATTCNEVTDTSALLKNGGLTKTVLYGYKSEDGLGSLADYENYSGGLEDALEIWFNSKFTDGNGNLTTLGKKIQNETWCLGGNINYRYDSSNGNLLDEATSLSSMSWYYAPGKRMLTTKTTDLTCGSEEDKVTSRYGALTADEVALAGGGSFSNYSYYLNDNVKNSAYWTLSRADFSDGLDYAFVVFNYGYLNHFNVYYDFGVRPAVSLATNTQITGGDGTIGNPYIIG